MSLTRKENLRRVLAGQTPQWVPFALNFRQWFDHHQKFNTLPPALQRCRDYVEACRVLDCDIFTRNVNAGFHTEHPKLTPGKTVTQEATGPRTLTTLETPFGSLTAAYQYQTALSTGHDEAYFVKDWARDGDAFRYVLDQYDLAFDLNVFEKIHQQIGDDGIVNVPCGCTPLKFLHLYFGLEYATLFVMDYPEEAAAVCEQYWSKLKPVLQRLAAMPEVESVILMDNVDVPFYPPTLARQYWTPYVKQASELMRGRGKHLFVHACGKLAGLAGEFAQAGVSGLEGVSHPPLGDWPAPQAQQCHDRFIFMGGFSAHEQREPDDRRVQRFYEQYLGSSRRERFIFSSSCQTAIETTWDRIVQVRDVCRAWGGQPAPLSAAPCL